MDAVIQDTTHPPLRHRPFIPDCGTGWCLPPPTMGVPRRFEPTGHRALEWGVMRTILFSWLHPLIWYIFGIVGTRGVLRKCFQDFLIPSEWSGRLRMPKNWIFCKYKFSFIYTLCPLGDTLHENGCSSVNLYATEVYYTPKDSCAHCAMCIFLYIIHFCSIKIDGATDVFVKGISQ